MTRDTSLPLHPVGSWETLTSSTPPPPEKEQLSYRPKFQGDPNSLGLELHPLGKDGIIISVTPPRTPRNTKHVPCDIVLVIDISGSMNAAAPVPATDASREEQDAGLSVLDLVKHAARTIVETLNDKDRLGIVTYGNDAEVVQELIWMHKRNKTDTVSRIEKLTTDGMTNMWHGMKEGLQLFRDAPKSSNLAAMMVLTDGMPNHMCPPQGYVPKLRTYAQLPASIHTFGFGYSIRSGLLKSISEVGGGNYAFIPDSGMIGTVFIHAVANLQNTFATAAALTVHTPSGLKLLETCGDTVEQAGPAAAGDATIEGFETNSIVIPLGHLQYGQSRDIYLQYALSENPADLNGVHAQLTYTELTANSFAHPKTISKFRSIMDVTDQPDSWIVYHRIRSSICQLLSKFFPIRPHDHEHVALTEAALDAPKIELDFLIQNLKSLDLKDELNQSLLSDLCGADPHGQISLAVSKPEYWSRWGRHYLLSLWNAHSKQICNSFKDPGPLMYGREAPLFIKCRDELDAAFDRLPAPKPSRKSEGWWKRAISGGSYVAPRMSSWNRVSNPCFAGSCFVEVGDGKAVRVDGVRRGMKLWTAAGPRAIAEVVRTEVKSAEMCVLGDCLVTPWHPVRFEDHECSYGRSSSWVFPTEVAEEKVNYTGAIYSIMLERGADERAHTIRVGGIIAVTLGHGVMVKRTGDARAHDFFGNYDTVQMSLQSLPKDGSGIRISKGITKGFDGLADGFASPNERVELVTDSANGLSEPVLLC